MSKLFHVIRLIVRDKFYEQVGRRFIICENNVVLSKPVQVILKFNIADYNCPIFRISVQQTAVS